MWRSIDEERSAFATTAMAMAMTPAPICVRNDRPLSRVLTRALRPVAAPGTGGSNDFARRHSSLLGNDTISTLGIDSSSASCSHGVSWLALGPKTRRRIRLPVAAAGGEGEEPRKAVTKRLSLDELDQQLEILSSRETSAPRQVPIPRQTLGDSEGQQSTVNGLSKLQWPNLTTSFFVYTAIVLVLLTIANNVVYKIFLGPPGVDRKQPFKTSVPETPRFRITSREQEREAREAKAHQDALGAQLREAPLPLE
ncbi:unnamed protein product [Calypogeia fissa]